MAVSPGCFFFFQKKKLDADTHNSSDYKPLLDGSSIVASTRFDLQCGQRVKQKHQVFPSDVDGETQFCPKYGSCSSKVTVAPGFAWETSSSSALSVAGVVDPLCGRGACSASSLPKTLGGACPRPDPKRGRCGSSGRGAELRLSASALKGKARKCSEVSFSELFVRCMSPPQRVAHVSDSVARLSSTHTRDMHVDMNSCEFVCCA